MKYGRWKLGFVFNIELKEFFTCLLGCSHLRKERKTRERI
jgi:hypothetical protein